MPVFGSDRPPAARTTCRATSGPREVSSANPSLARVTDCTRVPACRTAPASASPVNRALSTSRARLESGNSLPPASSCSGTPSSRKNATVPVTGSPRSTRRTIVRLPPQKSVSATTVFVTLHRPPPLTRIFAPGFSAPSSTSTCKDGAARRANIAVARPAAPAPTTATSQEVGRSVIYCARSATPRVPRDPRPSSALSAARLVAAHDRAYTARVSPLFQQVYVSGDAVQPDAHVVWCLKRRAADLRYVVLAAGMPVDVRPGRARPGRRRGGDLSGRVDGAELGARLSGTAARPGMAGRAGGTRGRPAGVGRVTRRHYPKTTAAAPQSRTANAEASIKAIQSAAAW